MDVSVRPLFATYLYMRGFADLDRRSTPQESYDHLARFHAIVAEQLSAVHPTVIYVHVNTSLLTFEEDARSGIVSALRAAKGRVDAYLSEAGFPTRMGGLCSFGVAHRAELTFGTTVFQAVAGRLMNSLQRMVEVWDTSGELARQAVLVLDSDAWTAVGGNAERARHPVESGREFHIV